MVGTKDRDIFKIKAIDSFLEYRQHAIDKAKAKILRKTDNWVDPFKNTEEEKMMDPPPDKEKEFEL